MLRVTLVATTLWLVHAAGLEGQAPARTRAGGGTVGVAGNLAPADRSLGIVTTLLVRLERRGVGVEMALPVYQYWTTIDPVFRERARSMALAPGVSLQIAQRVQEPYLFAGVGGGWLVGVHDSSSSGPYAQGFLGVHFRVSGSVDGRIETRSRLIEQRPTVELAMGLEMWR